MFYSFVLNFDFKQINDCVSFKEKSVFMFTCSYFPFLSLVFSSDNYNPGLTVAMAGGDPCNSHHAPNVLLLQGIV